MENQENTNNQAQAQEKTSAKMERVTPEKVNNLHAHEVFVFGSNLQGRHDSGDARIAFQRYGAKMGQSFGPQGRCYAIPTLNDAPSIIKPYAEEFIDYAKQHPELAFLVTKIGSEVGCSPQEVAPMFKKAVKVQNVYLPMEFWDVVKQLT